MKENLVKLTSHRCPDIRSQAGRSLLALRTPVAELNTQTLDDIDILDVLKI